MAKVNSEQEKALIDARHNIGLYSISELKSMFDCGRNLIDYGISIGELKFISPNNKTRYIYLKDFLEFMNKFNQQKRVVSDPGKDETTL